MWLQADFARALLLIGLLLCMVALGGEEASRYVADTAFSLQSAETVMTGGVTAPVSPGCRTVS